MEFLTCDGYEDEYNITIRICGFVVHTECFELSQSKLSSLPAMRNHQGGLGDSEDEYDSESFCP